MPNTPHFRLASAYGTECCEPLSQVCGHGRLKLADLDTRFQCSIIGTCLTTGALRKVMSKLVHTQGASDLDLHHDAVGMASEPGPASKALNKALDHQHAATLARFARVTDAGALEPLWDEALRNGDIPGAYWAVLTHRHATTELRKKIFGDVHMLSHLVGAANRADIRRLVALEQSNADLRSRIDGHHDAHAAQEEANRRLREELETARRSLHAAQARLQGLEQLPAQLERARVASEQVALQTQRREAAEQATAVAQGTAARLVEELAHLRKHASTIDAELHAAEAQFRDLAGQDDAGRKATGLHGQLRDRRILYVGGRPSSTPSIRALVERNDGIFRHHDGGLEDRKGLLTANVRWAEVVVFPVDCVDHDSVGVLKQLCGRHAIEFRPLRSAGIGSFAAAFSTSAAQGRENADADASTNRPCRRHG